MGNRILLPLAIILPALLAGVFALDRYWTYVESQQLVTQRESNLALAQRFANAHPDYWRKSASATSAELKSLVQQAGVKSSVRIVYLTELTKEAGNDVQERNVMARLVEVGHEPLVRFLSSLEKEGSGIKVKELRLKPSKQNAGAYQDVELVVSTLVAKT